ncbi:class I SAM-dependent methyltransferase [Psychrobacter ciconiae]|uniref:SAM-dependent methyltransferase n=1 Tax=Psychrobacter ciconiae TaxID=1553449 RepID=UPI00191A80B7|nr:SAM-dependent methyltransferase [Psychrobacter ciconiae]
MTTLSHRHCRAFLPEKLFLPRDFFIPEVVATKATLALEIGAGRGKHALSFAIAHSDCHLIAIERTKNKFMAFEKSALQQLLPNLTAIHADAIAWTVFALPPKRLSRIFILYPNPEQHNPNQQWLNMPFFEFLLSRLQTGGEIVLASNIEAYIDNSETQARDVWQLKVERARVPDSSQRTHFEVKYLARGEACWQLTMIKPNGYQTRFDDWLPKES